jgi:hypothetical protein
MAHIQIQEASALKHHGTWGRNDRDLDFFNSVLVTMIKYLSQSTYKKERFQRFQFMVRWPHCFGVFSEVEHIMVGSR